MKYKRFWETLTCEFQRTIEFQKSNVIVIGIYVKSFMTNDFVNCFAGADSQSAQEHVTSVHFPQYWIVVPVIGKGVNTDLRFFPECQ